jgi:hypothetical protein
MSKSYPGLIRYLYGRFAEELSRKEVGTVNHVEFSNAVQAYLGLGSDYQRAKPPIILMWRYYKEKVRPLYRLVEKWAPIEIDRCFREARGEEQWPTKATNAR